jgi:capsid protein
MQRVRKNHRTTPHKGKGEKMNEELRKKIIKALKEYENGCEFDGVWTIYEINRVLKRMIDEDRI